MPAPEPHNKRVFIACCQDRLSLLSSVKEARRNAVRWIILSGAFLLPLRQTTRGGVWRVPAVSMLQYAQVENLQRRSRIFGDGVIILAREMQFRISRAIVNEMSAERYVVFAAVAVGTAAKCGYNANTSSLINHAIRRRWTWPRRQWYVARRTRLSEVGSSMTRSACSNDFSKWIRWT